MKRQIVNALWGSQRKRENLEKKEINLVCSLQPVGLFVLSAKLLINTGFVGCIEAVMESHLGK